MERLHDDVLVLILRELRNKDQMTFSQVCKRLRKVTSKHLEYDWYLAGANLESLIKAIQNGWLMLVNQACHELKLDDSSLDRLFNISKRNNYTLICKVLIEHMQIIPWGCFEYMTINGYTINLYKVPIGEYVSFSPKVLKYFISKRKTNKIFELCEHDTMRDSLTNAIKTITEIDYTYLMAIVKDSTTLILDISRCKNMRIGYPMIHSIIEGIMKYERLDLFSLFLLNDISVEYNRRNAVYYAIIHKRIHLIDILIGKNTKLAAEALEIVCRNKWMLGRNGVYTSMIQIIKDIKISGVVCETCNKSLEEH